MLSIVDATFRYLEKELESVENSYSSEHRLTILGLMVDLAVHSEAEILVPEDDEDD